MKKETFVYAKSDKSDRTYVVRFEWLSQLLCPDTFKATIGFPLGANRWIVDRGGRIGFDDRTVTFPTDGGAMEFFLCWDNAHQKRK